MYHLPTPTGSHSGDPDGKYGVQASASDPKVLLLCPDLPPDDPPSANLSSDCTPWVESNRLVERPVDSVGSYRTAMNQ